MGESRFEDFVGIISALNKEIQRIKTAEAHRLGFRGSDVMCLYYLVKHPDGLTASELARMIDVSRAAMSRTIAHLAEDGFVEVGSEEGEGELALRQRLQMYDSLNHILEKLKAIGRE